MIVDEPDSKPNVRPPQPDECEACQFETATLTFYPSSRYWKEAERRGRWLCALCASTFTGNALEYPEQYHDGQDNSILFAVCYVGNAILKKLDEVQREVRRHR